MTEDNTPISPLPEVLPDVDLFCVCGCSGTHCGNSGPGRNFRGAKLDSTGAGYNKPNGSYGSAHRVPWALVRAALAAERKPAIGSLCEGTQSYTLKKVRGEYRGDSAPLSLPAVDGSVRSLPSANIKADDGLIHICHDVRALAAEQKPRCYMTRPDVLPETLPSGSRSVVARTDLSGWELDRNHRCGISYVPAGNVGGCTYPYGRADNNIDWTTVPIQSSPPAPAATEEKPDPMPSPTPKTVSGLRELLAWCKRHGHKPIGDIGHIGAVFFSSGTTWWITEAWFIGTEEPAGYGALAIDCRCIRRELEGLMDKPVAPARPDPYAAHREDLAHCNLKSEAEIAAMTELDPLNRKARQARELLDRACERRYPYAESSSIWSTSSWES